MLTTKTFSRSGAEARSFRPWLDHTQRLSATARENTKTTPRLPGTPSFVAKLLKRYFLAAASAAWAAARRAIGTRYGLHET